jgi:23S rRNA G2445 N2-methylase RlmL
MLKGSAQPLDELRLIGAGGTNKVMAGELSRLARRALPSFRLEEPRKAGPGALVYAFDPQLARLAVFYHRTCVRVLWDILESSATRLEPLFADVVEVVSQHASRFAFNDAGISVYAHAVEDFAAGERQIIGTVKNGLIEGAARCGLQLRLDPDKPDLVFSVRGDEGRLRVSLDLAGRPMNQRGYRMQAGTAPLREDLAAVLLMLARYDPRRDVLIDPLAGSGTIAIEAACMAQALPVWVPPRRPSLADMPAFRDLSPAGNIGLFADTTPRVFASDILPDRVAETERAAQAAGVAPYLRVRCMDFRDLTPASLPDACAASQGLIIANPPYGERMERADLLDLYADLGEFCGKFEGYRAAFFVANREFEHAFGWRPRIKKPLSNGPLRGYFYAYEFERHAHNRAAARPTQPER